MDGLRFDVGAALAGELEQRGLIVKLGFRLSALPTVTATAKPAVMGVPGELHGASGDDFAPLLGLRTATAPVLREALAQRGVEVLEGSETRFPSGAEPGGWAEFGQIDAYGHAHPDDLPVRVKTEVLNAADRILQLLDAGWKKVRVVTDHGWLLMPEGLPKVELPAYLAATKWSRCAVVKGDAAVPSYPWHWNPDVRIASPPGIASFRAGEKYAHGGVSLQECVVPEIVVEQGVEAVRASIVSVEWRGMRCRVKVDSNDPAVRVDLRTNWKQAGSSIVAAVKEVGSSGEVSLAVADDKHEGAAAAVVVIDSGGDVLMPENDIRWRDIMSLELDALDQLAASAFDGYLVRKDLVRKYSRQYPVPTYVVEFLLGRYCASTDEKEIAEGLADRREAAPGPNRPHRRGGAVQGAGARSTGSVKLIDIVRARLDAKNDCYVAELPSLALRDVRIGDDLVRDNERMLTDGFYAEVTLAYDGIIAQEKGGRPFRIESSAADPDVEVGCARRAGARAARRSRPRSGSTS